MKTFLRAMLCAAILVAVPAHAQDVAYPKGPVKMIVPFPPGGPTDLLGRILSQKLQELWAQPVVIEYKPGAGTVIGVDAVAKSAADGYTIGLVNSAYTINPVLLPSMPYNTVRDLANITQVVNMTMALVANPQTPFSNVQEMVAYAKRNPGKLTYATPGAGGAAHLAGELLNRAAGIDLVHVPYKGSSPAQTDVVGGRVDLMIDPLFSALPFIRSGKMKVVALAAERRVPGFEQYPVIAENYSGVTVSAMLGLVVPAATPRGVINRIHADVAKALDTANERKRIAELGMDVAVTPPDVFDAFVKSEMAKWGKVIREAKIQPPQ